MLKLVEGKVSWRNTGMDGRLTVTVVLFIWRDGMCMELNGRFHDPMASPTEVLCTQMHFRDNSNLS